MTAHAPNARPALSSALIATMAQSVVDAVHPVQVVLFGSYARGEPHARSDLDFLVVLPDGSDRKRLWSEVYQALRPFPVECDLVVTTPNEIARRGDLVGHVLRPALLEGKVLYDARTGLQRAKIKARSVWEVLPVTERERLETTRRWLTDAEAEFRMAGLAGTEPVLAGRVCFFAQQASEKLLKAVLIFLQIQYPFTHKLDEILALIPPDWPVKSEFGDLDWLSAWAVKGRYVGDWEPAGLEEAADALEIAQAIREAVLRDLQAHGYKG